MAKKARARKPNLQAVRPTEQSYDLVIVGAGAAGLMAAATLGLEWPAGRAFPRVLLLDRLDQCGKKLRATGNGRGNVAHSEVRAEAYVTMGDPATLESYLRSMELGAVPAFMERLGWQLVEEDGRLYPRSFQAVQVRDALEAMVRHLGVEVRTLWQLEDWQLGSNTSKRLTFASQDGLDQWVTLSCEAVLFAMGGHAQPALGADGRWLDMPGFDALSKVPLKKSLQGLTVQNVDPTWHGVRHQSRATLWHRSQDRWKWVAEDEGEVQFTAEGVSGVVIMQLSLFEGGGRPAISLTEPPQASPPEGLESIYAIDPFTVSSCLVLDLFPEQTLDTLTERLQDRTREGSWYKNDQILLGLLPDKLSSVVLRSFHRLGLDPARDADQLAALCKAYPCPLGSYVESSNAQVSLGGIELSEIDEGGELRAFPGVWVAGEMLDATGLCGGYNLQLAFASGIRAARQIRARWDGRLPLPKSHEAL